MQAASEEKSTITTDSAAVSVPSSPASLIGSASRKNSFFRQQWRRLRDSHRPPLSHSLTMPSSKTGLGSGGPSQLPRRLKSFFRLNAFGGSSNSNNSDSNISSGVNSS